MAEFCLATRISPSEYKALTINELAAFMKILKRD
jgi:hypothetical protein